MGPFFLSVGEPLRTQEYVRVSDIPSRLVQRSYRIHRERKTNFDSGYFFSYVSLQHF